MGHCYHSGNSNVKNVNCNQTKINMKANLNMFVLLLFINIIFRHFKCFI